MVGNNEREIIINYLTNLPYDLDKDMQSILENNNLAPTRFETLSHEKTDTKTIKYFFPKDTELPDASSLRKLIQKGTHIRGLNINEQISIYVK